MKTIICTLILIYSATAPAASDEFGPSQEWLMVKYDLNGDASITQNEVIVKKQSLFNRMDANSDGEVTFGEYETMDKAKRSMLLHARFAKLDSNNDGRVSDSEYGSYLGRFESIDSNGDGTVSRAEIGVKPEDQDQDQDQEQSTHCLMWFCVRSSSGMDLTGLFD